MSFQTDVGTRSASHAALLTRPWKRAGLASLLVAATAVLAPAPANAAQVRCAASDGRLVAAMRQVHDKQQNVGLQVAIERDGKLVFSSVMGMADRDRHVPVSRTTRFPIASITKAFTGVATLKAVGAGVLDLDAPIQKYVPEFPTKPQLTITPRRLAAHRTGIRHWGPEREALYSRHFERLVDILPLFKDDPLPAGAGNQYQYSSYGYNLLGLAVERATGVEFKRFVERTVIIPLRLTKTAFDDVRRPARNVTKLYSAYDFRITGPEGYPEIARNNPLIAVPPRDYSHNTAGGNMTSTAEDLVRFGAALLRPALLPTPEYKMLFVQPEFGGVKSPMSFGFFASDEGKERRLSISGSNPGVQAGLLIYPERKLVVAVLSNSWGFGSRSGEMTSDLPKQLADLCGPPEVRK